MALVVRAVLRLVHERAAGRCDGRQSRVLRARKLGDRVELVGIETLQQRGQIFSYRV